MLEVFSILIVLFNLALFILRYWLVLALESEEEKRLGHVQAESSGGLVGAWTEYPVLFPIVALIMVVGVIRLLTFHRKIRGVLGAVAGSVRGYFASGQKARVSSGWMIVLLFLAIESNPLYLPISLPVLTVEGLSAAALSVWIGFLTLFAILRDGIALFLAKPFYVAALGSIFALGLHWSVVAALKIGVFHRTADLVSALVFPAISYLLKSQVEARRSLIYALSVIAFPSIVGHAYYFVVGIFVIIRSLNIFSLTILVVAAVLLYRRFFGRSAVAVSTSPTVDDVSRLNSTPVDRIFYVRTAEDIKNIVLLAREEGKSVSIRGQSHTMGGHTIASGGYVIDTKFLTEIRYDADQKAVAVGPGATWADLIRFLNPLGLAPEIMQSYCSFSVGGTIAVNAHGITSDWGMVESVLSLRVINADGDDLVASRTSHPELFSCIIGGFGLFGVVHEVTLRVVSNVKIGMEMIKVPKADFDSFYSKVLKDPSVEVKIARVEITSMDEVFLFLYRRTSDSPTISDLSGACLPNLLCESDLSHSADAPREMSTASQLLYKWVLPIRAVQAFRFAVETYTQTPMDWAGEHDRNLLLYESAKPLAKLYEPIFRLNQVHFTRSLRFALSPRSLLLVSCRLLFFRSTLFPTLNSRSGWIPFDRLFSPSTRR